MGETDVHEVLRTIGVWSFTDALTAGEAADFAQRIEAWGYSALWVPETLGRDPFAHIGFLGGQTERLLFATGIASIFHRHAGVMKQAAATLAEQTGGRFVLGLGVSHEPMVAGLRRLDYRRPLTRMRAYLEDMDASPYTAPEPPAPPPRVLAALGPKMLDLAGEVADGAHPYWTTPEHTAEARARLGPGKLLCVEQKVVLSTDAAEARETARRALAAYSALPNYRNNWLRLGWSEEDIESQADRFVDAVVGWGDEDAVRNRVQEHLDAGADHVCIQALDPAGGRRPDLRALEALAPSG